ncbi:hypothetical protein M9458_015204, partial [Cirrhinus mrigala]
VLLGKSRVHCIPRCPQEISLPTLPVLLGSVVSSEPTPQSIPPGNVPLRSSATFQRGLFHSGRPQAGKEAIKVVPPHDKESGFYSR